MIDSRVFLWINTLSVLALLLLMVWAKSLNAPVRELFLFPYFSSQPTAALLTRTFQLSCAVSAIVCAFSYGLLATLQPRHPENRFLLGSALITGGFFINEIYRIHLYFGYFGIPKVGVSLIYALILCYYGWVFRRDIQATPYKILVAGLGLLFFAIAVDTLKLKNPIIASLLEGIPKLFSGINIAIYYWYICKNAVEKSFSRLKS